MDILGKQWQGSSDAHCPMNLLPGCDVNIGRVVVCRFTMEQNKMNIAPDAIFDRIKMEHLGLTKDSQPQGSQ
jgi:hypothetical protein